MPSKQNEQPLHIALKSQVGKYYFCC